MTVQQLSGILDGFGDSIPFTKEAYGTGEGKEGKGGAIEGGTPSSCLATLGWCSLFPSVALHIPKGAPFTLESW